MKKIVIILIILFCILFLFVLLFGRYALALFIQTVETRTVYINQDEIQEIKELLSIEVEIKESPNGNSQYQFPFTFHIHYSTPYTLQSIFSFIGKQIEEIEFETFTITINNKEYDLFSLNDIYVMPSRYYIDSKSYKSSSANPNETNFFRNEKKLLLNESEKTGIKAYYINFLNLPIKPDANEYFVGNYMLQVVLLNGESIRLEKDFRFKKEDKKIVIKSVLQNIFE